MSETDMLKLQQTFCSLFYFAFWAANYAKALSISLMHTTEV